MISNQLRDAVRLHRGFAWQLARQIGVHPTVLSKWLSGAQPPRAGDRRVIALGALVGVAADACFEPEAPSLDRISA